MTERKEALPISNAGEHSRYIPAKVASPDLAAGFDLIDELEAMPRRNDQINSRESR